jgi:hypothetical protein
MKRIFISTLAVIVLAMASAVSYAQSVVPHIVYSSKLTGQTAVLASTTAFTPSSDGLYRVSVHSYVTGTGTINVNTGLNWNGGVPDDLDVTDPNTNGANHVWIFTGKSGVAVKYYTYLTGGGSLTSYDFYITIEELL